MSYDVIVIGAGAAGMMAAVGAGESGARTLLLEKNAKVGRKIGITGKGRCNVTNDCDRQTFMEHVVSNPRFLYSALDRLGPQDMMRRLESQGVSLKVERGNRVFPVSDRSFDIIDALLRGVRKSGAQLCCGCSARRVETGPEGFTVFTDQKTYRAKAIILATGGLSYPNTGSTGDGYRMAKGLGLTTTEPCAGLSALITKETWPKDAMGVTLKNVAMHITSKPDGKSIVRDFGEVLLTHFGVSGPVILSASSRLQSWLKAKKKTFSEAEFCLHLDLKSALSHEQLDERLRRDLDKYRKRSFQNALDDLLPRKLIPVVVRLSQIPPEQPAAGITKEQRRQVVNLLKDLTLTITAARPIEEAIVTMGGVEVRQIDPRTMMAKTVPGLFVCGELLDVDALTGGFNLQIAFSTGLVAGESAASYCKRLPIRNGE